MLRSARQRASRSTQFLSAPFRPHDLLRLADLAALDMVDPPAWVADSLARAPWVVVRRGAPIGGGLAVGVRGETRGERFAARLSAEHVVERLAPEDLAACPAPRPHPAFEAMATLGPLLDAAGLGWGPAGAAGFELATGRPALTGTSDLDLVLRAKTLPPRNLLASIAEAAARAPLRVDILIETPQGGFAFDEALGSADEILLRTWQGPRLVPRAALLGRKAAAP